MIMQNKKLFVGGLNHTTDECKLKEFYSTWGVVENAVIVKNESGNSRCFGFVTFSDADAAQAAYNNKPHEIDGKIVDAKPAVPKNQSDYSDPTPSKKLFVGGLNRAINESQLREYFGSYGEVIESVIMVDRNTGVSRGFGFVSFSDGSSVDKVIATAPHSIGTYAMDVKKAMPKRNNQMPNRNDASHYSGYQNAQAPYYQAQGYPMMPQNYGAYPQTAPSPMMNNYMGYYPGQNYYGGPMRDQAYQQPKTSYPYDAAQR